MAEISKDQIKLGKIDWEKHPEGGVFTARPTFQTGQSKADYRASWICRISLLMKAESDTGRVPLWLLSLNGGLITKTFRGSLQRAKTIALNEYRQSIIRSLKLKD